MIHGDSDDNYDDKSTEDGDDDEKVELVGDHDGRTHLPALLIKSISVPVRVDTSQLLHHPVVLSVIVEESKEKGTK